MAKIIESSIYNSSNTYPHIQYCIPNVSRLTETFYVLIVGSDADKRRSNGIFTREKRTADGRLSTTQVRINIPRALPQEARQWLRKEIGASVVLLRKVLKNNA